MKAKVTLVLKMDDATIEDFMRWRGWPKEALTCQGAIQRDFTNKDLKREIEDCDAQELVGWCDIEWAESNTEVEI